MMRGRLAVALLGTAMLGGCAGPSLLLLDNEDGSAEGALAVIDEGCGSAGGATIAGAYSRTKLTGCAPGQRNVGPDGLKPAERTLLSAMPPPPARFIMYFIPNTTDLAPGSEGMIDALDRHFKARPGAEIEIIGHTDTVGRPEVNQRLSEERANEIRAKLIALNFPPDVITTTGRGETDLRFDTPDNTDNAGNRRVEIIVR